MVAIIMAKDNKYLKYKKSNKKFVQPTADQMEMWFRNNGIKYRNVQRNGQFRICNPDGDTKFCVEISKEKALVHDFRPNHQQHDGSFIRFVSVHKGISIQEAINEVCGGKIVYSNGLDSEDDEDEEIEDEIDLPSGSISLRDKDKGGKIREVVINYLTRERGLSEEIILQANIHYLGTSIVVPYYEYGMIVFWQIRRQLSKIFQFPTSSSKSAGDFLYGFDNIEPNSYVIITESIFNTLSVGSDSAATGGASLKEGQIKLLKSLNVTCIILAPDNDDAGIKSAIKDYHSLKKYDWDIYCCLPPYSKDDQMDWNDMKKKGIDPKKYILDNKKKMSMMTVFNGIDGKIFKY